MNKEVFKTRLKQRDQLYKIQNVDKMFVRQSRKSMDWNAILGLIILIECRQYSVIGTPV